jgi:hypothetical protein
MNKVQMLFLLGGLVILIASSVLAMIITASSWITALVVALVFVVGVVIGLRFLRPPTL